MSPLGFLYKHKGNITEKGNYSVYSSFTVKDCYKATMTLTP